MNGMWTLPQSAFWLIYGRLQTTTNSSVFDVINDAIRAGDAKRALAVRDDLQSKLIQGDLVAYGLPPQSLTHIVIPATDWLKIDTLLLDHVAIPKDAVGVDGRLLYREVKLKIKNVKAVWPRVVSLSQTTEHEVQIIILSARAERGTDLTIRALEQLRAEKCAGISRDKFRELAREVQGRKNPGRPMLEKNARK